MPTYQYSCTECGHFFEIVQSFTDDSLTVCPECEGRLRKVFNAVGVVFKGSGFYRNDSRPADGKSKGSSESTTGGSSSEKKSSSGSESSSGGGSGTKTESKPAAKTEKSSTSSSSASS